MGFSLASRRMMSRTSGSRAGRPVRPGPLAGHEPAVPPQQGLGPDQERLPALPRQNPAGRGKERPTGRSKDGSLHLPPEHGELVAQNRDLDVLVSLAPSAKSQELEESPEHHIEEGEDHEPRIVPKPAAHRPPSLLSPEDRVSVPHVLAC